MVRAAKAQAGEGAPDHAEREAERVRLIGHQPVHPERDEPVRDDRPRSDERVHEDARLRLRVAAEPKVDTARDEADNDDARDDGALAESAADVQHEQEGEHDDRRLPRATAPAREASRSNEQHRRERRDERLREPVHLRGVERRDERTAVLREDGVPHREDRDARHEPCECGARPRLPRDACASEHGAGEAGEHGRHDHGLLRRRVAERLMRGDLADDEDRDSVQGVEPAADRGADAAVLP